MKKRKGIKHILIILLVFLLVCFGAFFVYASNYYRAEINESDFQQALEDVTIRTQGLYNSIPQRGF